VSFFVRLLSVLAPPAVMHIILHAGEVNYPFFCYLILGCIISLLKSRWKKVLEVLFLSLGALVCFVLLLITPFSAYAIWFDCAAQNAMHGSVSRIFVLLSGYLSLVAAIGGDSRRVWVAILDVLSVNLLLLFIAFRRLPFILFSGASFCAALLFRQWGKTILNFRRCILILIIMAGLSAAAILPFSSSLTPRGIPFVDNYLSSTLKNLVLSIFPRFPLLYGIPGYGYGIRENQQESKPVLSQRPVFSIRGGLYETYRLRAQVFDYYTGSGWVQTLRSAESVPQSAQNEGVPRIERTRNARGGESSRCRLTVLTEFYPFILHELDTDRIILSRAEGDAGISGDLSVGLVADKPLVAGEGFELSSWSKEPTPKALRPAERKRYTVLPGDIPARLLEFAEPLMEVPEGDVPSALSRLLQDDFTYNLDADVRGKGWDFLTDFLLSSREGYCVHFATAAAVLFRIRGIPARYVSGFFVRMTPRMDSLQESRDREAVTVNVTGFNSHAWVEYWSEERGWVPFEATPPMMAYADDEFDTRLVSRNPYTLRQLEAVTGKHIEGEVSGRKTSAREISAIAVPGMIVVATTLVVLLLIRRKKMRGEKLPPQYAKFMRYGQRAVRTASSRGVAAPEVTGWLAWEDSVQKIIRLRAPSEDSFPFDVNVFREVFFGGKFPATEDMERARRVISAIKHVQ